MSRVCGDCEHLDGLSGICKVKEKFVSIVDSPCSEFEIWYDDRLDYEGYND